MVNWDNIRKDFPVVDNIIYFQSAGMSPIPTPVFDTLVESYREIKDFGDIHWEKDFTMYRRLCATLGSMLHTQGENITFVHNTSTAMSMLALAFLKDAGGKPFHVVSLREEFPSSTVPYEYQRVAMKYVDPVEARYPIDDILAAVNSETLAVLVSHVQYATGFRLDVHALGQELKKRNVPLVVNATQAFPFFPLDVEAAHVGAMTISLHKWGCAGHVGSLLYTSADFRRRFPTPMAGWISLCPEGQDIAIHTQKNVPLTVSASASQYQLGTINFQPFKGLATALDYVAGIGVDNIQQRIFTLADYLIAGLRSLGVYIVSPIAGQHERSAIVSFQAAGKSEQCVDYLAARKIYAACRNGNVRVSLNVFNNHDEIDRLLRCVQEFLARG